MGIVQTFTTRLKGSEEQAHSAVVRAMQAADLEVDAEGGTITGRAARSIRRNRWAAEVVASFRAEDAENTVVDWSIDMAGDKHFSVLDEVLIGLDVPVDDLGVADALERLGKMGRFFGGKEARELSRVVHVDERVIELAQGVLNKNQGMLVLTSQRVFFFDKKFLGSRIEEFELSAITSLGQSKAMGGETINISISGRSAEIKQVAHGRSDVLIRAFRQVKADLAASSGTKPSTAPDLADQIRKLADLRDARILSDAEFEAKKTELLGRI